MAGRQESQTCQQSMFGFFSKAPAQPAAQNVCAANPAAAAAAPEAAAPEAMDVEDGQPWQCNNVPLAVQQCAIVVSRVH